FMRGRILGRQRNHFVRSVLAVRWPLVEVGCPVLIAQIAKNGIWHQPVSVLTKKVPVGFASESRGLLQMVELPQQREFYLQHRLVIHGLQSVEALSFRIRI